MCVVNLEERSQITLPAEVSEALALREGDYLGVELEDGAIVLRPVVPREAVDGRMTMLLRRSRWQDADPAPSEEELAQEAQRLVDQVRRERA